MKPLLIDNSQLFNEICDEFSKQPVLAIDTEFFRETSYFPHLGLVQIATPECIVCVDPLAFDARKGLTRLLLDNTITKIFHACIQDLEVLYHYLGGLPCPVIDTQIAAALLGQNEQIGYAALVEEQMGVVLEKSQTRTNWLKRPLTTKQIEYAGDDVLYLLPLYQQQSEALKDKNREQWLLEECRILCSNETRFFPDIENSWQRVKGIYKLKGKPLHIAHAIALWREQLAIKKDMTRKKIIPDDLILQIAVAEPEDINDINKIGVLSRWLNNDEIISLSSRIKSASSKPKNEWFSIHIHRPAPEEKKRLSRILRLLEKKAGQLGIAQSILCPRKEAEKLASGERDLQVVKGWRLDSVGKQLLNEIDPENPAP